MSVFTKLNVFADLGNLLERKAQEKIVAVTQVVVRAALVELDKHAPVLTDVIAGRAVKARTTTEFQIDENPTDTV